MVRGLIIELKPLAGVIKSLESQLEIQNKEALDILNASIYEILNNGINTDEDNYILTHTVEVIIEEISEYLNKHNISITECTEFVILDDNLTVYLQYGELQCKQLLIHHWGM